MVGGIVAVTFFASSWREIVVLPHNAPLLLIHTQPTSFPFDFAVRFDRG
jgi:hypothetical protein